VADLPDDAVDGSDVAREHWLVRPRTIRRLWVGFAVVLALIVLAQAIVPIKSHSSLDGWPGFAAAYGFIACVVMVLVAKALGALLKRRDDYYDA
jgi:hypothetical protein